MANPFKQKPPVEKPNRNTFDLSFANNLTLNFGKLYPVLCKEVIPGDSFNIKTSFGLRFMPMAFPVQTRVKADIHFFYVRNRNLWKDWADFIGSTKENLTPPYIQSYDPENFKTGSLADYLGLPTTLAGSFDRSYISISSSNLPTDAYKFNEKYDSSLYRKPPKNSDISWINYNSNTARSRGLLPTRQYPQNNMMYTHQYTFEKLQIIPVPKKSGTTGTIQEQLFTYTVNPLKNKVKATSKITLLGNNGNGLPTQIYYFVNQNDRNTLMGVGGVTFTAKDGVHESPNLGNLNLHDLQSESSQKVSTWLNGCIETDRPVTLVLVIDGTLKEKGTPGTSTYANIADAIVITDTESTTISDISELPQAYIGVNPPLKVSALPFRAYESIYNGFFRNTQVDPFKINGVVEHNKYILNNEGGADTKTPLTFNHRYWEDDVFTTCLPSPQQGLAPLVGARTSGDATGKGYNINANIDGKDTNIEVRADQDDKMTLVTNYDKDIPESTIQALNSAISYGISINDFRNVNSLQRWLEKNVRRGYRYKDQILTHFGVNVRYDVLDMPEFLGGVTENVTIQAITQTVENEQAVLGAYAGQGQCFGQSNHDINHYFDEHGFVIAVLSVIPIPTYSQILPKHFTKFQHLDYFFPEFNHIGLQPLTQRELAPLQAINNGVSLDQTFGYQRAWYDYLASVDEVHGDMRTTLRDFLLNRVYNTPPELGHEFLTIKPEDTNDIFTVREGTEDKIVGQVYFNIKAKRPISRFAEGRID